MKKIIVAVMLLTGISANAASVSINPVNPSVQMNFSGASSFVAPEVLNVALDGENILSKTVSGAWATPEVRIVPGRRTVTATVNNDGVVTASNSITFALSSSNGDPMAVGQPWGLTGYETAKIASTYEDCPLWFPKFMRPCWDVKKIPNFVQNSVDWYYRFHSR